MCLPESFSQRIKCINLWIVKKNCLEKMGEVGCGEGRWAVEGGGLTGPDSVL